VGVSSASESVGVVAAALPGDGVLVAVSCITGVGLAGGVQAASTSTSTSTIPMPVGENHHVFMNILLF
jgi:hypothetical protein